MSLTVLKGLPRGISEIYFHPALPSPSIPGEKANMLGGQAEARQRFKELSILIIRICGLKSTSSESSFPPTSTWKKIYENSDGSFPGGHCPGDRKYSAKQGDESDSLDACIQRRFFTHHAGIRSKEPLHMGWNHSADPFFRLLPFRCFLGRP